MLRTIIIAGELGIGKAVVVSCFRQLRFHSWQADIRNRTYGTRKLGFPHAEELLRQLTGIWAHALKTFRQPCPKSCKFKEHRFEETTACLGPDLTPKKAYYSTAACVHHVMCTCTSAVPSRVCPEHCTCSPTVSVINAEQMGLDDISGHAH
jgi:hypothetical protein